MRVRAVVVLLLIAALLGAPPRASAATNQLLDPTVGPASGSTMTVFTFRVRYEGSFAAVAVTATVAGLTLPMARTAGSPTSGTWTAASVLPGGTWRPTFAAVAAQGNQPTLLGPTVVVAAPAPTADPTDTPADVAPTPEGPAPGPTGRTAPIGEGTAPTATPAPAAPVATVAQVAATPTAAPAQTAPGSATPGGGSDGPGPSAAGTSAAGTSEGTVSTGGGTAPAAGHPVPGATPSWAPSSALLSIDPAPGGSRGPRASDPGEHGAPIGLDDEPGATSQVGMILAIGLTGVAAFALVGLAVLLARRRREENRTATVVATESLPQPGLVKWRPSRTASVDLPDDPIVAALGLGRDELRARNQRNRRPD